MVSLNPDFRARLSLAPMALKAAVHQFPQNLRNAEPNELLPRTVRCSRERPRCVRIWSVSSSAASVSSVAEMAHAAHQTCRSAPGAFDLKDVLSSVLVALRRIHLPPTRSRKQRPAQGSRVTVPRLIRCSLAAAIRSGFNTRWCEASGFLPQLAWRSRMVPAARARRPS